MSFEMPSFLLRFFFPSSDLVKIVFSFTGSGRAIWEGGRLNLCEDVHVSKQANRWHAEPQSVDPTYCEWFFSRRVCLCGIVTDVGSRASCSKFVAVFGGRNLDKQPEDPAAPPVG